MKKGISRITLEYELNNDCCEPTIHGRILIFNSSYNIKSGWMLPESFALLLI